MLSPIIKFLVVTFISYCLQVVCLPVGKQGLVTKLTPQLRLRLRMCIGEDYADLWALVEVVRMLYATDILHFLGKPL